MSVKIDKVLGSDEFYIVVENEYLDKHIATILKIDIKEYRENLKQYGNIVCDNDDILFDKKGTAIKAMEDYVIPLYIAAKLGGKLDGRNE